MAEPIPWDGWQTGVACAKGGGLFLGCPGYRVGPGAAWIFPLLGWVTGLPDCGLRWGCTLFYRSDLTSFTY